MKPLYHKIFVLPVLEQETTTTGLAIIKKQLRKAIVLAAGPGTPEVPTTVKEGDHVLLEDGVGAPFEYNGQPGLFVHEKDIYSIV